MTRKVVGGGKKGKKKKLVIQCLTGEIEFPAHGTKRAKDERGKRESGLLASGVQIGLPKRRKSSEKGVGNTGITPDYGITAERWP